MELGTTNTFWTPLPRDLIEEKGVRPEDIEDAYVLAEDVERRVVFSSSRSKVR